MAEGSGASGRWAIDGGGMAAVAGRGGAGATSGAADTAAGCDAGPILGAGMALATGWAFGAGSEGAGTTECAVAESAGAAARATGAGCAAAGACCAGAAIVAAYADAATDAGRIGMEPARAEADEPAPSDDVRPGKAVSGRRWSSARGVGGDIAAAAETPEWPGVDGPCPAPAGVDKADHPEPAEGGTAEAGSGTGEAATPCPETVASRGAGVADAAAGPGTRTSCASLSGCAEIAAASA
ncbi:hypothetical protein [Bordetella genomosp. 13]|uniref:hypothetical protein n=1 Tax=Bordetella genomosp. 13 TaxID=463040 RepID=UPI00391F0522